MPQASLFGDAHDPASVALKSRIFIEYKGARGKYAVVQIQPLTDGLYFGTLGGGKRPQWLLRAVDIEQGKLRTFALRNIRNWDCKPERI